MSADSLVTAIRDALIPLADAERAQGMRAYMRDQFDFLGIQATPRRQATALLLRTRRPPEELLAAAAQLWALPQREYQYIAIDLLGRHRKTLGLDHIDPLLTLAQQRSWWDTVDGLADIVGDVVRAACRARANAQPDAQSTMDAALRHDNLWVRRVAMLHQLGWRGDTDSARLFNYALSLAPETDFFIRKAIGWALRDYARHDPSAIRNFLTRHRQHLSSLSTREAAKHL